MDAFSISVTGTMTFNSDLTFQASVIESVNSQVTYPAACFSHGGLFNETCDHLGESMSTSTSTGSCSEASGGGCTCTVSSSPSMPSAGATYSLNGSTMTITTTSVNVSSVVTFDYCVQGAELFLLPPGGSTASSSSAVVVLEKQ